MLLSHNRPFPAEAQVQSRSDAKAMYDIIKAEGANRLHLHGADFLSAVSPNCIRQGGGNGYSNW
jgi:hypothetical protein